MTTSIHFLESAQQFHLSNGQISYIFKVSDDGKLLHLYYGKSLPDGDYSHFLEMNSRPMTAYRKEGNVFYSLEHLKQELPEYGTSDFRHPAISIRQENGSQITDFCYYKHDIQFGKPLLDGLPATYVVDDKECQTLIVTLKDDLTGLEVDLHYTIFQDFPVISRHTEIRNCGVANQFIEQIASLNLDLPDANYEWLQLSGAWARERHIKTRPLQQGIQAIQSTRGISSPHHNPFVALKRKETTEHQGEVIGASLVYSGNFLIQAEVDTWDVTRLQLGINPFHFAWKLEPNQSFISPEALIVFSDQGLNGMSQVFHQLFRTRLARSQWKEKERPILINHWEATYFDYTETKLLEIARGAIKVGVELFVVDDGWFGKRVNDKTGLGDWFANRDRLPNGIGSLASKIREIGLKFGLWFEPEMVNKDSRLFRDHPDWYIHTPDRPSCHGRNQFVLNFTSDEVVDYIFQRMSAIIEEAKLDYIKWDMNRSLTEVYSCELPADQQGEVFHRYVLGVYKLYDRLTRAYPNVLFESCSSGGGRFDPGILYYAPQGWTSDDSDAIERLKIQYGTSLLYPLSSMGAHVSTVPNHQLNRITPLKTRANVAYFGVFGYELDLNKLSSQELDQVAQQIAFYKEHRKLFHSGNFYRLLSPFDSQETAWMVVSENKDTAILAHYKLLNQVNRSCQRLRLTGLNPEATYEINGHDYSGYELMRAGFSITDSSSGELTDWAPLPKTYDFDSRLWVIKQKNL